MEVLTKELDFTCQGKTLQAICCTPANARSVVIFSHGSGSSRFSTRNNFVAGILNRSGIATVLPDLLTSDEDQDYENRFDIPLLSSRLSSITKQLLTIQAYSLLPLGYFGASTGAASAMVASIQFPGIVKAVVSRGGRPDLAAPGLGSVKVPCLFILGSMDMDVIKLNKQVFDKLTCIKKMEIIDGAGHLFEEPGALDKVADLARDWFVRYLR